MYLFTNLAKDTLAAELTSGSTSCTFSDGSMFQAPTGGDIEVLFLVDDEFAPTQYEIVYLTARSGATGTITRAREGTSSPASWAAGTVVAARVSATVFGTFPQLDNGGNAKGSNATNLQPGRSAAANVASGAESVAIGYNSKASASDAVALGHGTNAADSQGLAAGYLAEVASHPRGIAIGNNASAGDDYALSAEGGVAIGDGVECHGYSTVVVGAESAEGKEDYQVVLGAGMECTAKYTFIHSGIPILGNTGGVPDAPVARAIRLSGGMAVLATDVMDFTATDGATVAIPENSRFYPFETLVILTAADTISGQPSIAIGVTGNTTAIQSGTATSGLAAVDDAHVFGSLTRTKGYGNTNLEVNVTAAGTATAMTGRVLVYGFLVEDE